MDQKEIPLSLMISDEDLAKLEAYTHGREIDISDFVSALVRLSIQELENCGEI